MNFRRTLCCYQVRNGSKGSVFSGIPVLFQLLDGFMWICGATAISLLWWALELVLVTNNSHYPSQNLPPHSCVLMKWQKFFCASSLLFMLDFQERCHKLNVFKHIFFDVLWRIFSYFLKRDWLCGIITSLSDHLISLLLYAR